MPPSPWERRRLERRLLEARPRELLRELPRELLLRRDRLLPLERLRLLLERLRDRLEPPLERRDRLLLDLLVAICLLPPVRS
jgi:hypothetical protein